MDSKIFEIYTSEYDAPTPIYITRLQYIINHHPKSPIIKPLLIHLLNIVLNPSSPYNFYLHIPKLISLLSQYSLKDASHFQSLYLKNSPGNVQVEQLIAQFDHLLLKINQDNLAVSMKSFGQVHECLQNKAIALWALTGTTDYVSTDNTSFYYNVHPDYLNLMKNLAFEELEETILFKFIDGSVVRHPSFYARRINQILACYKADNDDPDENDGMDIEVDAEFINKLSRKETVKYWHCCWWLVYSAFINDDYKKVVDNFDKIINADPVSGVYGAEVLNEFDNLVVIKEYLLRVIVLSILITKKNVELDNYWEISILKSALKKDTKLNDLVRVFTKCDFYSINKILKELGEEFSYDFQLGNIWKNVEQIFRYKCYITYLSLIKRVKIGHIAKRFGLDDDTVYNEILNLSIIFDLSIKIDKENKVIEYESNDTTVKNIAEFIHRFNHDNIISTKAVKINALVTQAFPE